MRVRDPIGLPHVHVYAASVPCPSFSAASLRLGADAPDDQGLLIWNAVAAVTACRPSLLIFEQVPGFMTAHGGSLFGEALASLQCGGAYSIWHANVCTSKNGLPQRRRRL
jgi:site-specific DNA-cytosine methylase